MNIQHEVLSAFNFRYACKGFDPEKIISEENFLFILETGRLSPSSFGYEPWNFLVIQNSEIRKKLKKFCFGGQQQLTTASHFIILLARKAVDILPYSEYIKNINMEIKNLPEQLISLKSACYKNFLENSFDLTDERKLFDWTSKQVYIPLANMMSSTAQIGIDSCPMEGFEKGNVEKILEAEGILDTNHFEVAVMLALGYRPVGTKTTQKSRQSLSDIVQWVR